MSEYRDELLFLAQWIADTLAEEQPGVAGPDDDGWDRCDDGIQVKEKEVHILVNRGTHPMIREYTIIVRRE